MRLWALSGVLLFAAACSELRSHPEVTADASAGTLGEVAAPADATPTPGADAPARDRVTPDIDAPGREDTRGDGSACPAPVPAHCTSGSRDGDESDVDCGGAACPGCPLRRVCQRDADCQTGTCQSGRCALYSLSWQPGAPTDLQHYAHTAASDGKLLYALGGGESGPTCAQLPIQGRDCDHRSEVFDPSAGRWSLLPIDLWPTVGRGLAAGTDDRGVIYLFGGAQGSGANRLRPTYDAVAYLPGSPGWVTLARMTIPRAFHAVGRAPDGSFVVVGGAGSGGTVSTRQGCTDLIDRFVPAPVSLEVAADSGSWSTIGKLPAGLCQPAMAPLPDGKFLVVGGRQATAQDFVYQTVATVLRLDPMRGTTESLPPLPRGRYALAAVAAPDGRIYVIGGRSAEADTSVTAEVLAFDPESATFQSVTPLQQARSDLAAVIGPDLRLHVIGGLTETGSDQPNRTTETYGPAINLFPTTASQSGTDVVITSNPAAGRFAPDAEVEVFLDRMVDAPLARGRTGPDGTVAGRLELPISIRVPRGVHDVYVRDSRSRYPARARLMVGP